MSPNIDSVLQDYDYIGWIPCVVGRLDFSKISTDQVEIKERKKCAEKSICLTYRDEHSIPTSTLREQFSVISSVFNWKDRKDPNENYDGFFRFIAFSYSDQFGDMKGRAFLILQSDINDSQELQSSIIEPLAQIEESIRNYDNAISENQYEPTIRLEEIHVKKEIKSVENKIDDFLASGSYKDRIIQIDYLINKNGMVFLNTKTRDKFTSDIKYKAQELHSSYICSKQCFIYLKSVYHKHKHHKKEEDRITSIHRIDSASKTTAALKLIDDLRRSLIELKDREHRSLESPEHFLQGFISYTKSLVQSLNDMKLISDDIAKAKHTYFDNMLQSWQSIVKRTEESRRLKDIKKENNSKAIGEFFQSISILIAIFSLLFHGFRYVYADPSFVIKVEGTYFESFTPHMTNPMFLLETFTVLFFLILTTISLRIAVHPHGIIRRPLNKLLSYLSGRYLKLAQSITIALLIFLFGLLIT